MTKVAKPGHAGKWETVRRLRYGDVLKLIRYRYGANGVPDDDAGRPDLMELLYLASMAPAGAEKKVRNNIELYAPWTQAEEIEVLIRHLDLTPHYQKVRTAEELGRLLHLTNAEREPLKLWRLRPIDMTPEQLAQQTNKRERIRRAAQRRKRGIRTRDAYLAELAARPKPWLTEGISRRTWERRQKQRRNPSPEMSQHESETIVGKQRTHLATTEQGLDAEEGPSRKRSDGKARNNGES